MEKKKVLLLDNYDSFTYNLVHAIEEILEQKIDVRKNDQISLVEVQSYDYILLSPGPGLPDEAGILKSLINEYGPTKKILGVCLGLQAIGEVYGSKLKNLKEVYHGLKTKIFKTENHSILYDGIEDGFLAGRYHSWVIDKSQISDQLEITGLDDKDEIMSIQHKEYNVHAVQFHPESIMTEKGNAILKNFFDKA